MVALKNLQQMKLRKTSEKWAYSPALLCCMLFLVFLQLKHVAGASSACADLPMCECKQVKDKISISCTSVTSIDPISKLLKANYIGKRISKLSLPQCKIESLSSSAFTNLTIESFDSSCPFKDMENGALIDVRDLYTVSLTNAVFSSIPESISELVSMKSLILRRHQITNLNKELQNLTSLTNLEVSRGLLSTVSNDSLICSPNLTSIVLSYNKLQNLPNDLFDSLKELKSVDLNGNQLQNVDGLFKNMKLETIKLYDNKLKDVEHIFRENMSHMATLILAKNPLTSLNSSVFVGKAPNIKNFDLSRCLLSKLDPGLLQNLSKLKEVYLQYNLIKSIPDGFFHNLQNLQKLNLSGNLIQSLDGVFFNNPQLQKVYLSKNQISNLNGVFKDLPELSEVYLKENRITELNEKQFTNCSEIRVLDVSQNNFHILDSKCFDDLLNLKLLIISKNSFPMLNHSIQNLPSLQELYADVCSIKYLDDEELVNLPKLSKLSLTNNEIENVDGAFSALLNLTILYLEGSFKTITRDSMPPNIQLTTISLKSPALACDCRLQWLLEWQEKNSSTLDGEPACFSPERLKGRHLDNLTIKDLIGCSNQCSCNCGPVGHEMYSIMNCSRQNLHKIPESIPERLGKLDMSYNLLNNTDNLKLNELEFLMTLNLSDNNFSYFNLSTKNSLETLHLHKNSLTRLELPSMKQGNLTTVTLSENPWLCDCQTVAMKHWMKDLGAVVKDAHQTRCANDSRSKDLRNAVIISLSDEMLCPETTMNNNIYVIVGGVVGAVFVIFLSVCCYWNRSTLKKTFCERGCTCLKCEETTEYYDETSAPIT